MVGKAAGQALLLEREDEVATLTGLVDAVAAGSGGVVWVDGPAGIGKTRLLRVACEHADGVGVRVLSARSAAPERDFAFGVVRGLFEPAVTARPEVLAAGPAMLAAPVVTLRDDEPASAGMTMQRLHGLYWLTVGLADDRPLLIVVDDAQWADEPSLRALAYLVRRVPEMPVGIVMAARPDVGDAAAEAVRDDPATVLLRPRPLSRQACDQLVRTGLGPAAGEFVAACHDAAGGNPLLLDALLVALAEDGVAPDESGVESVRRRAQAIVAGFVLRRLRHLPPAAVALADAVAVLGTSAELRHAAELAGLDGDTAVEAADALETADLLASGRPLTFAHPLIGEAVYGRHSHGAHHREHRRAARCLAAAGVDPESVAAHLLAVDHLGDPWTVERLRAAAAAALAKGAPGAAVTYLQRAVVEPPAPERLPEVLVELGVVQLRAGDGDGYATLRRAWEQAPDAVAAARIALAVSRGARSGGGYGPAEEIVVAAIAGVGATEPELVADLQTELALTRRIGTAPGRPAPARVAELADAARARGDEVTELQLRLAALDALAVPEAAGAAGDVAERAAAAMIHAGHIDGGAMHGVGDVLMAVERLEPLLDALDALVAAAQVSGWLLDLGILMTLRAQVRFRLGRLAAADEDARLGDRLAVSYGAGTRRHTQAWLVASLLERRGPEEAERELLRSGVPATLASLLVVRARLRLAQDRPAEALADLDECGRVLRRRHVLHPNYAPWQAWSAVALLRLGRDGEARARAAEAVADGRRYGSARAEGVALWASGLAERSPERLAEAVAVLARVPAPLERARALVDLGAALRRGNRRSAARGPLEEALQIAHECGAGVLAAAARAELAAAGVHVRRAAVTGPDALTPTERRIAELAAGGASNRDIAQTLFVTPKTVENHLGNAYRKLGVAGRGELRQALSPPR